MRLGQSLDVTPRRCEAERQKPACTGNAFVKSEEGQFADQVQGCGVTKLIQMTLRGTPEPKV
jgi:hypothetical protein